MGKLWGIRRGIESKIGEAKSQAFFYLREKTTGVGVGLQSSSSLSNEEDTMMWLPILVDMAPSEWLEVMSLSERYGKIMIHTEEGKLWNWI